MNPTRFSILLISICFSFNFLFLIPAWAENNSITPQSINQTNISEPNTLAYQSVEERLNLLDSRVNDLVQSTKKPQKDFWDKLGTMSVLISGMIIGSISLYATNCYQKRQQRVEETQTIQSFMTYLTDKDYRTVSASLRSVEKMNQDMAFNLAEIFYSNGGFYTLVCWSKTSDKELAKRAKETLGPRKQNTLIQALELYNCGMPRKDIIETMTSFYEKQQGITSAQVEELEVGIDVLLRAQKKT